jgi:lipopolysaccharide export system protein LptC
VRRRGKRRGWFRALLVTITWLPLLAGCGTQRSTGPVGSTGELPDQEVRNFVLTETDQGNPVWKLYARYAAMYDAKNSIVAQGVRVDFFDAQGKKTSELSAREGEIDRQSRDMIARGNVVIQTTEGTRMSTEELRFLNRTQKVRSNREVRVERAGNVLTGVGFESDPDLKHYEFMGRVHAQVRRAGELTGPQGGSK